MADTMMPDGGTRWADTRWLSYDDLVEIAGIKRASVTRMVRRKKWPKRLGNERGSVRVAVPIAAIEAMQGRKRGRPRVSVARPSPSPPDLSAIAREIGKLETALSEIRTERDHLRVELERERRATIEARQRDECNRATAVEDRTKMDDQRARLSAQVNVLAAELARLHALPRAAPTEHLVNSVPLLSRVGSLTRWFRP